MKEPIPEKVKEAFFKNNIYILLSYWLKGLTGIQEFYGSLTTHYGLDVLHNISSALGVNITEAEMLGLSTSARPSTIVKMIENFFTISAVLCRPNVSYQEVLEVVNPQEAHCTRLILENVLQSASKRKEATVFFEKVIPENIKQLRLITSQLIALREATRYSLEDLDLFLKVAQGCCTESQSSIETSFEMLISNVSARAREFFQQKHEWWLRDRRGPEANIIINAWELLSTDQARIQIETPSINSGTRSPNFKIAACPTASLSEFSEYCRVTESTHSVIRMIEDLIEHINLSTMSPTAAIEIMDLLLTLSPQPLRYHQSWRDIVPVFRKHFFALPRSIIGCVQRLDLETIDERALLRREQGNRLDDYIAVVKRTCDDFAPRSAVRAASAAALPSSGSPELSLAQQEMVASSLLRRLLKGPLNLEQEPTRDLLEAIFDLFILPRSDSTPSIGFATFVQSKGGIFERHLEVGGDHFMLPWSPYWLKALISGQTLKNF
jgi:hypothetical protein